MKISSTAARLYVVFLFISLNSTAQKQKIWDPNAAQRFAVEAAKDPAYKKFKAQLELLLKKANGPNTQAASIKSLFDQNTSMFEGLYNRSNIQPPGKIGVKNTGVKVTTKSSLLDKLKLAGQELVKTKTPPYQITWRWTDQGGGMTLPDTSMSQYTTGKVAMVFEFGPIEMPLRLGRYHQGFYESFTVPNNPEIIAAEIKFEYSFLYTAWDTYGGSTGLELLVRVNDQFTSPELSSLPAADADGWSFIPTYKENKYDVYNYIPTDTLRVVKILHPRDTVTTEIGEWHAADENGAFTMRGYVHPGATIKLNFGIGYMIRTRRGYNGNYHYLECRLKKITVNFLKTAN